MQNSKFCFIILIGISLLILVSCNQSKSPYVEIISQSKKESDRPVIVNVEVADTEVSRQQGLMYRDSMDENAGMLFIMPNEQNQIFWMKNTRISLDILFIYSDWSIAGIAENTKTFSTDPISVDKPTKYVLEVNAGYCKKHNILAGDKIVFHP